MGGPSDKFGIEEKVAYGRFRDFRSRTEVNTGLIGGSNIKALLAYSQSAAGSVERTMDRLLPAGDTDEARVFEAMRYASLGGGKRLRAFFVLAGATLFRVGALPALRTASAIEFVHAYSLIHDDLPSMDDDDLRRGKPSCHKANTTKLPAAKAKA